MSSHVMSARRGAFHSAERPISPAARLRSATALSGWLIAGGVVAVAALSAGIRPAAAQSLDQAIAAAVTNSCAALGGSGNVSGNLSTFCAAGGVGGASSGGGGTTASQSGGAGTEGKVKKRLLELRGEADAGTGLNAQTDAAFGSGLSAGEGDATFGAGVYSGFVSLDYENVNKDTTAFTSGFDSDKFGGTLGLDRSFGKMIAGAALNYAHTAGDFDNVGGDFATNSYGVTLYGSLLPMDNLYIDAVLGYARKDTSLDRNASANQGAGNIISGTAISDSDADEYSVGISGGYDFSYESFTYGPRLAVNYTRTEIGDFRESGNSGLELDFDSQSFDSLTTSVGGHVSTAISTGFGVLVPQLSAEYIHEFANDQQTLTARFVQGLNAGRLRFQTDSPDRDYFGVGAGMVIVLPNGFSPYMNYRALLGDSIKTTQTVTAGLRVEF